MNHLTKFDTYSEYVTFRNSQNYERPNVSSILEDWSVRYEGALTFKMKSLSGAIEINKVGTASNLTANIEYSIDGGHFWNNYAFSTNKGLHIELSKGDSIKFRGVNTKFSHSSNTYYNFAMSGDFNARGDITSLINGAGGDCALPNFAFVGLFSGCTSLLTPPKLPSTTLSKRCYDNLFKMCISLKIAPELPAKDLSEGCYRLMFGNCEGLTKAPALRATGITKDCYRAMFQYAKNIYDTSEIVFPSTVAEGCYQFMFNSVTALTVAPELPATTLAKACYYGMFQNCQSLVHSVSKIPATIFPDSSCSFMFGWCSNLIDTPKMNSAVTVGNSSMAQMFGYCVSLTACSESALTAMNLGNGCYRYMFTCCSTLTVAPELPATALSTQCYYGMFYSTRLLTAPELRAANVATDAYWCMFQFCKSLTGAPYIASPSNPAATPTRLYQRMFEGCSNLTYIKAMFTSWPVASNGNSVTGQWVYQVKSTGTFVANANASFLSSPPRGNAGIPNNWTIQAATE